MLDGIILERAGLPAAVIISEPFVNQARLMAASHSCPDFPFVVVPHPVGNKSDEVLQAWAEAAVPAVLRLLRAEG